MSASRRKLTNILQVRLPSHLIESLNRMADQYATTKSEVVRRLIIDSTRHGAKSGRL